MKAIKVLPEGFHLDAQIDLSRSTRLVIGLNVVGLALFFVFGWLFGQLAEVLRPELTGLGSQFSRLPGIVTLLAVIAIVVVAHELVHGLFFWIFIRERPTFGLRGAYAFAAAPDWYLPRNPYLAVGLAPLVVLTAMGLAMIPFLPLAVVPAALFALSVNAAGAVGDLIVVGWLLTKPPTVFIQDEGDAFSVYRSAE